MARDRIALIFQSTRSQDRDISVPPFPGALWHFNPLGRKTETESLQIAKYCWDISIHSVARPRQMRLMWRLRQLNFNPLGRKTETKRGCIIISRNIFQSTRSQDRDQKFRKLSQLFHISIHSVARPRPYSVSV